MIQRDGTRRLSRHWALPAPEERRETPSGEVIEEFNEVLGRAVADRLRGPRASLLLSGGLDSPALALAARRNAPAVALTAITHSWRALLPADDEGEWAALAAKAAGLAHRVTEMAPDCGFVDAGTYRTPEPSIDPEPGVWRAAAAELASVAPVALLGEDVDTLLFPTTLVDQLRSSGLVRTWQRWRAFRTETGARPWVGLRRSSGAIERWRDARARRAPAWVDRSLLSRHPFPDVLPGRLHPARALAARALSQPIWENSLWDESPAMSGAAVQVLLPYMDPRVITFLFSLPSVPWAQRKHLMRSVLRGAMPDALVARPKTPMAGYYEARVRQWRRLGATADPRSPMGSWVDLRKLKAILANGTADEVFAAWRVIELARWLAQPPVGVR